jgi:excinuclease ABC subunit C
VEAEADEGAEVKRRFAYPPGLLVIDGGQPQVRAAQDALMLAGITDVPVVGLAKRLEEVWMPDDSDPVILPRSSEALYLLQRVRDEAHRTAIALHRKRRGKSMATSALDAIDGLGEVRARALMKHFGSMKALKAASEQDLQAVPGVGPALAARIHGGLHQGEASS